jgi:hypothetical protein
MRARALQRGDFENRAARFTTAEVNANINESIADLYDQLIRARGTDYYEQTSAPVTINDGQSLYALDAEFLSLVAIELSTGSSRYPLDRFERYERPYLLDENRGWMGQPYYYVLTGNNIELLPTPRGTGLSFTYRYIPVAGTLAADGDAFDGINGWEEWVVVDVARKLATKESDDVLISTLSADLQRLEARIRALAGARDRFGHRHVIDVRRRRYWEMRRR